MSEQEGRDYPAIRVAQQERTIGGHNRHGRPASWALVAVVIAAFAVGGAAIIEHLWWLFWVCAGVVVLAVPAGKVIGIMDDTV
jgi:fatty acid desaturase